MFGCQGSLDLGVERRVPIFKCVVCDWETPDPFRLCTKTPDCGAMVILEHHGMAKTAWLAGVAELRRRKVELARRRREGPPRKPKPDGDAFWRAVGADKAGETRGGSPTSQVPEAPAPTARP